MFFGLIVDVIFQKILKWGLWNRDNLIRLVDVVGDSWFTFNMQVLKCFYGRRHKSLSLIIDESVFALNIVILVLMMVSVLSACSIISKGYLNLVYDLDFFSLSHLDEVLSFKMEKETLAFLWLTFLGVAFSLCVRAYGAFSMTASWICTGSVVAVDSTTGWTCGSAGKTSKVDCSWGGTF